MTESKVFAMEAKPFLANFKSLITAGNTDFNSPTVKVTKLKAPDN
eukprot:CAMPEP_0176289606 /NCGR_PEP_ID=MMETSP0121_2-20121125/54584_1 /TAXON_ID=160619 /ORGANISM="Kryptoperidinium foliaceum, Strain CCMP 1326" /LENGTH=44 /DNA_ID= /DNA_START= /DNA_END= /DNA_ORIENTATION=